MFYHKMAVVTGGLGFIGKNFINELAPKYKNILVVDKFSKYSDMDFYKRCFPEVDILFCRVKDFLLEPYVRLYGGVDIFNFAAESHVCDSFDNGPDFVLANAYDTSILLEQIKKFRDNVRLVHISTDEVYGERVSKPALESDSLRPTNPYAASKAAADMLVQTYSRCYKINAVTIRANNIYGPQQHVSKLIPKAIYYASEEKLFPVHGDGLQVRHFLHTSDFCIALFCLMRQWDELETRIFNIAGDTEYSVRTILKSIYQNFKLEADNFISYEMDRPFNDRRYLVDDSAIRRIGWAPKMDFNAQLDSMCRDRDFFLGRE
jgi:dTDP-glucose 4,6-dehydratase